MAPNSRRDRRTSPNSTLDRRALPNRSAPHPERTSRRKFLGYCVATAALVASYGPRWATRAHADPASRTESLEKLRRELSGELLLPEAHGFEALRAKAWNARVPERRPDLIVVARDASDVQAVVRFARAEGLRIAPRGGGHSWCAFSLREGGILLDLSGLAEIAIDPEGRSAVVGPGVACGTLVERAAEHGLAFPVAHCPSPMLSGYLLNGGFGWNTNVWGPACASVEAVEMVTAKGELVRASQEEHADLFWAARGGGPGFFAAVVRYHLKLHPLPRALMSSTYTFSVAETGTAAALADEVRGKLPAEVELAMIIAASPADLAAETEHVCVLLAVAFSETEEAGRRALQPLDRDPRLASCLRTAAAAPTSYADLFAAILEGLPGGRRYLADTFWTDAPLPRALDGLATHYGSAPSPRSTTIVSRWSNVEPPDAALSLVRGALVLHYTIWDDEGEDDANLVWHDRANDLLAPHVSGHYIGEVDIARRPERAERSYSKEAWSRLREIRAGHDPDGVFVDHFTASRTG